MPLPSPRCPTMSGRPANSDRSVALMGVADHPLATFEQRVAGDDQVVDGLEETLCGFAAAQVAEVVLACASSVLAACVVVEPVGQQPPEGSDRGAVDDVGALGE